MCASVPSPAPACASPSPDAFTGEFEIHLTVDGSCPAVRSGALAAQAAEQGWKYAHIVLDRGRTPDQPMVTLAADGTLGTARSAAQEAAEELAAAGCPVVRVKVEAAPWACGVPATDGEGAALGPAYYFEHHVKLLLPSGAETARLAELVVGHAAHLSRNARRVRADGQREQFVTQRCRRVGSATAGRRLDALLAALASFPDDDSSPDDPSPYDPSPYDVSPYDSSPYEILSVEREFVVYDSAEVLDAGWIAEAEGVGQQ
ncbi:hypothetical protein ACQEU8_06600 [Streptomyces sp. CA-250714]|uniref:hypothetical protein n=1 Tax=Streptomyces sp. CA-250714 TaxID=3240060 RepID=UPI003D8C1B8D